MNRVSLTQQGSEPPKSRASEGHVSFGSWFSEPKTKRLRFSGNLKNWDGLIVPDQASSVRKESLYAWSANSASPQQFPTLS
jgi:hypothetical protein